MHSNRKDKRSRTPGGRQKVESSRGRLRGLFSSERKFAQFTVFAMLAVGLYFVLIAGQPPLGIKLGEPSPADFTARDSFQCADHEATQAAREKARRESPRVFRRTSDEFASSADALLKSVQQGPQAELWRSLPKGVQEARIAVLVSHLRDNKEALAQALRSLEKLPVAHPEAMASVDEKTDILLFPKGPGEKYQPVPASEVIMLTPRSQRFRDALGGVLEGLEPGDRELALSVLARLLKPNIVPDVELTQQRADRAAQAIPTVQKSIPKGFVILKAGTEVRKQHIYELEQEKEHYWSGAQGRWEHLLHLVGVAVLLVVIMGTAAFYVRQHEPDVYRSNVQFLSFAVFTLGFAGLARLFFVLGIPVLLVPVPLMVMSLCLVYNQRFAFEAAVFYALLAAVANWQAGAEFVVLMLGGMVAALLSGRVRTRSTLIKAGVLAGCVQCAAVWGLGLLEWVGGVTPSGLLQADVLMGSAVALGNGVISGFLISGLLPAVERLFGVTTDVRLLEWSDPNQPLLQRLLLDAPGTYHHSMLVGTLAAEAAEAIGANSLLARVGAYFHDIGKLEKPEYFVENLPEGTENPHRDLSPTMSSLIITAHPRTGSQMAEQFGLPKEVRDIILQSHGSTLVKYFYNRAVQEGKESEELKNQTFRYRLPKPQSKEAAIVMLCDSVESASRSLETPSPAKIKALVHETIMDRLHEGQLDESGLSLTDLSRLEAALVRGLSAIFHKRVAYPQPQREEEPKAQNGAHEDRDSRPAE